MAADLRDHSSPEPWQGPQGSAAVSLPLSSLLQDWAAPEWARAAQPSHHQLGHTVRCAPLEQSWKPLCRSLCGLPALLRGVGGCTLGCARLQRSAVCQATPAPVSGCRSLCWHAADADRLQIAQHARLATRPLRPALAAVQALDVPEGDLDSVLREALLSMPPEPLGGSPPAQAQTSLGSRQGSVDRNKSVRDRNREAQRRHRARQRVRPRWCAGQAGACQRARASPSMSATDSFAASSERVPPKWLTRLCQDPSCSGGRLSARFSTLGG